MKSLLALLTCGVLLGSMGVTPGLMQRAEAQTLEDHEGTGELSELDETAIQSVIAQQLEAFQQEDAEAAFSFASPGIQEQFGSADRFVAMVRASYEPVYRAEEAEFLELAVVRGTPAQQVRLVDPEGNSVIALYIMELQEDDSWRISACLLQPVQREGVGA